MRILKSDKRYITAVLLLQLFLGIYIALLRLAPNMTVPVAFDVLFFYAREEIYIDLTNTEFDVRVILSILDLFITIPLLSCILSRGYRAKCCYGATRLGSYKRLYFGETVKSLGLCFASGAIYTLGFGAPAFIISDKSLYDTASVGKMALSVFTYTLVSFTMVHIASIISVVYNEKIGMLLITGIFLVCAALLFFLPFSLKQWDPVGWYFVNVFTEQKEIFQFSPYVYYSLGIALDGVICFIGYRALKSKDIL